VSDWAALILPSASAASAAQARNTRAERQACEIRLRAERRVGQLLRQMEMAKEAREPGTSRGTTRSDHPTASATQTLSDLGSSSAAVRLAEAKARLQARFDANERRSPDASFWGYVQLMRRDDPDAALLYRTEMAAYGRENWRAAAAARAGAVSNRLRNGFVWQGGGIGGNETYPVAPFRYHGLASDAHPILQCFVTKLPRGRRLVCGDGKEDAGFAPHASKLLGCDAPYVEGAKTMRGFLRVEIDRRLSWAAIEAACRERAIPLPNIAVGWMDGEVVVHPHLIWLLRDSVAFCGKGYRRFQILFHHVLRDLTAALQPIGADPGGSLNCMRVKNPLSPLWSRRILAEAPHSLAALRRCLPPSSPLQQPASHAHRLPITQIRRWHRPATPSSARSPAEHVGRSARRVTKPA
jgi:Replicase family